MTWNRISDSNGCNHEAGLLLRYSIYQVALEAGGGGELRTPNILFILGPEYPSSPLKNPRADQGGGCVERGEEVFDTPFPPIFQKTDRQ